MNKKKAITLEIICFLFILLFVYAAVTKLMDYQKFMTQIGQSPLLTDFAGTLAWLVPGGELVIAGMLAVSRLRQVGLYAGFSLMVMFTAYIAVILQMDAGSIPCSCGGVLEALGWTEHLIFNIAFVIMGGAGILLNAPGQKGSGKEGISKPVDIKPGGKVSNPPDKVAEVA